MSFPALPTQVKCPSCDEPFIVQLYTIIDVGEEPDLKEQFIKGELNYARCPKCGSGGMLSSPLLYHDPAKELLVAYLPTQLNMSADQQEQFVGSLVNTVMNSMPAEERKGYFLQPMTVLTIDSLYDTILEADGVSKEVLAAQRARIALINQFLTNLEDEKTIDELVDENRDQLTYEFFLMLSDLIEGHRERDDTEHVEAMEKLRALLLDRVHLAEPSVAPTGASHDDIIDMLRDAEPGDAWRRTIAANRMRLDYGFFQALTAKIEDAEKANDDEAVEALTDLRKRILDEIDAQNRTIREVEDRASLLIMSLSEAEDLAAAARERVDQIDEAFFAVLSRYLEVAKSQDDPERLQKLNAVMETVIEVVEEKLPPDARLINRLLRTEYGEDTNAVLEAYRGLLTDPFLDRFDKYMESLEKDRDSELADHLKQVRTQIVAKMTILRA